MNIIVELIYNMLHSSVIGFLGVSGIVIFFAVIVSAAFYRIQEVKKLEEKHN